MRLRSLLTIAPSKRLEEILFLLRNTEFFKERQDLSFEDRS